MTFSNNARGGLFKRLRREWKGRVHNLDLSYDAIHKGAVPTCREIYNTVGVPVDCIPGVGLSRFNMYLWAFFCDGYMYCGGVL